MNEVFYIKDQMDEEFMLLFHTKEELTDYILNVCIPKLEADNFFWGEDIKQKFIQLAKDDPANWHGCDIYAGTAKFYGKNA